MKSKPKTKHTLVLPTNPTVLAAARITQGLCVALCQREVDHNEAAGQMIAVAERLLELGEGLAGGRVPLKVVDTDGLSEE